ncbi:PIR Superfamily Protein [Plasmodium ovale curtisi]|uniref:PIR Superfamily Protein n=1 Tax=Plasmodium ovale curtisi TaxID=864141 RepID=A0A1A8WQX9_PLAOA|nr:PIR Superfamily Protein [Plasmodium ovale curtisi]
MKENAINITKKIEKTIPLYENFEEIYSDQNKATTAAAQRPRVHKPATGFPGIRDVFHRKEMISENFEIGTKFDHSALGIVSVGLTATVLYRYACIRLWIRNLGRYNPNGISNMNRGEMEGFLSSTQEIRGYLV